MKYSYLFLTAVLFLFGMSCQQNQAEQKTDETSAHDHSAHAAAEEEKPAKKSLSPRTSAMANIGDSHVHIDYSSPSVRGRTVWGGLVAYDQVWVTGAHKATSISFSKDVMIEGQKIAAGTYGFFTIPGKEEWVLILNKNAEQHLADDYDAAEDVIRIMAKPEVLEEPVEALTYEVIPGEDGRGIISVSWEKIKVAFSIQNNS